MIEKPEITTTVQQETAFIHLVVPRDEMMEVFGPAVGELIAGITSQGVPPAGPIFARYPNMCSGDGDAGIPDVFDFELSVPVATPVRAVGRVQPGHRPAEKVARTVYHGPYEGLPGAWEEFMTWIQAEGLTPADDLWESYVAGPNINPDPASWRTELIRPIRN